MALTLATIRNHVLAMLDVDDSDASSKVTDYINMSARDIWLAHPWRERRAEATITTVAPYSTGTVSTSGATVTGSGTTFPAATAAGLARFAKSYSDPWYTVTTRDSATQLTLSESYAETALSGATYTLYQDVYELASGVDTLIDLRLLKASDDGPLRTLHERVLDEGATLPGLADHPTHYSMIASNATTAVKRVRLWPVPDAVYRVKYRYLKAYTDMSADGDECVVPESRRDLIICGALRWGYRLKDEYRKAQTEDARFEALLRMHWQRERDHAPLAGRLRRFDSAGPYRPSWDINTLDVN